MLVLETNQNQQRKKHKPMSRNEAREEILNKYINTKKITVTNFKKEKVHVSERMSLNDFYLEVQQKNSNQLDLYYTGKSAHDIEVMMMKNRQLIEEKKKRN